MIDLKKSLFFETLSYWFCFYITAHNRLRIISKLNFINSPVSKGEGFLVKICFTESYIYLLTRYKTNSKFQLVAEHYKLT